MRAAGMIMWAGLALAGLATSGFGEMLYNADFEDPVKGEGCLPTAWTHYSTAKAKGGLLAPRGRNNSQCAVLETHGVPKSGQGLLQIVHVIPGRKYDFVAHVKSDPNGPLRDHAIGQLVIEWLNETGREVGRTSGESWDASLSRVGWRKVEIRRVRPPERAAQAKFGIHLFEGDGEAEGAFLVDDVSVTER